MDNEYTRREHGEDAPAPQTPKPLATFDFAQALNLLKAGAKMKRLGWVRLGHILYNAAARAFIDPDSYIWFPTQDDLLSNDWIFS